MTFQILSVCTGNVCRSPIAALLLADALSGFADVRVESAGVGALVGHGVPEPAQRLGAQHHLDASAHVARQITEPVIRDSALIVAMAREHRRYIVQAVPAAMRRTFTLRELARIADVAEETLPQAVSTAGARTGEEAMRAAVALAASLRGTIAPPADPDDFDVIDPYRRSDEIYAESFGTLIPAARRVSGYLAAAARLVA
ncbi:low molecular weight phosphatase family protein [Microbacterium sp. NPDC016588]